MRERHLNTCFAACAGIAEDITMAVPSRTTRVISAA